MVLKAPTANLIAEFNIVFILFKSDLGAFPYIINPYSNFDFIKACTVFINEIVLKLNLLHDRHFIMFSLLVSHLTILSICVFSDISC